MRNDILQQDTAYRKALVLDLGVDTSCGIAPAKYRGIALKLLYNCTVVETRIIESVKEFVFTGRTIRGTLMSDFVKLSTREFFMHNVFRAFRRRFSLD